MSVCFGQKDNWSGTVLQGVYSQGANTLSLTATEQAFQHNMTLLKIMTMTTYQCGQALQHYQSHTSQWLYGTLTLTNPLGFKLKQTLPGVSRDSSINVQFKQNTLFDHQITSLKRCWKKQEYITHLRMNSTGLLLVVGLMEKESLYGNTLKLKQPYENTGYSNSKRKTPL